MVVLSHAPCSPISERSAALEIRFARICCVYHFRYVVNGDGEVEQTLVTMPVSAGTALAFDHGRLVSKNAPQVCATGAPGRVALQGARSGVRVRKAAC